MRAVHTVSLRIPGATPTHARRARGRMARVLRLMIVPALAALEGCEPRAAGEAHPAETPPAITSLQGWCAEVPRPANIALPRAPVSDRWYTIVEAAPGVYAFLEPQQFQEAVSYLIVGTQRALLFDTGIGVVPLRPLVERLTRLPVTVLNSHTHYDHVGGNWEFDRILTIDSPYTRANMAGFPHVQVATEVRPDAFCAGAPAGLDTARFHTRRWTATGTVRDGEVLDLGDRSVEVLHVPGHTPDAMALLDRANGLLWTGDSYYDGALWLYVPETDLDAYERSMARLVALAPSLRQLLPAHNTAQADPARLARVLGAVRTMRRGMVAPTGQESGGRVLFTIDSVRILTASALLQGKVGSRDQGGSGLTVWP